MKIKAMLNAIPQAFGSVKAGKVHLGTSNQLAAVTFAKFTNPKGIATDIPKNRAQQDRQHTNQPLALQIDRENDGRDQSEESHQPVFPSHLGSSIHRHPTGIIQGRACQMQYR